MTPDSIETIKRVRSIFPNNLYLGGSMAFIGNIPIGYEIDHIDNNKSNNDINNLRAVTRKENMAKSFEDNPHTILSLVQYKDKGL